MGKWDENSGYYCLLIAILDLHQSGKRPGKKLKNGNGKFKKHAAAGWKSD